MVLWDVISYSSVDLDIHFVGSICWNIVSSALLEMGSIEPGTVVRVTEVVCLTVCVNVILTFVISFAEDMI